jgi:biopolymer transport protein TolR
MRKSRYPSISEINVTNLVDVTMVLLIIFMITAPLLRSGIEVELPKSSMQDLKPHEGVVVTLTRDRLLYVNDEEVSSEAFEVVLLKRYTESGQKLVLLKADEEIPYGRVIHLMDQIKGVGITNLGLIVESGEEE